MEPILRVSARRFVAGWIACTAAAVLLPASAVAFGTVTNGVYGQHGEHERITRLALGCRPASLQTMGRAFSPTHSTTLPGCRGTFGAVGAADDVLIRWLRGGLTTGIAMTPTILEADDYPQKRAEATGKLLHCRSWAYDMLHNGFNSREFSAPTWGALETARGLLEREEPGPDGLFPPGSFRPYCTFDGTRGRAKCNVWEPFGYVLHAVEDFYSHSNWADSAAPGGVSVENPPGLGHRDLAPLWDLRNVHAVPPITDNRLTTGAIRRKSALDASSTGTPIIQGSTRTWRSSTPRQGS